MARVGGELLCRCAPTEVPTAPQSARTPYSCDGDTKHEVSFARALAVGCHVIHCGKWALVNMAAYARVCACVMGV